MTFVTILLEKVGGRGQGMRGVLHTQSHFTYIILIELI